MSAVEHNFIKDSKHKTYVSQIDKSLKNFEYSNEWADLISALGRLIKVIQSFSKTKYVPRGFLVGKRLAQCLHPALPAGVHCKALECYDTIFRTIESNYLAHDLPIYGPGLFSLLELSAMTVKPPLFDIYEEHLLRLEKLLYPAFIGLLQGLLPSLEPGAEFFERGNRLLEIFCKCVEPTYFYTFMWKLLGRVSSIRQFGMSFMVSHFNKRKSMDSQLYMNGLEKYVLLNSLYYLFGDQIILVQRDTLDFILMALPVHFGQEHKCIIQTSTKAHLNLDDTAAMVQASLCILLRRDASLNRRLFHWLKGAQPIDPKLEDTDSWQSASSWAVNYYQRTRNQQEDGEGSADVMVNGRSGIEEDKDEEEEEAEAEEKKADQNEVLTLDTKQTDAALAQQWYFQTYSKWLLIDAIRGVIQDPSNLPIRSQSQGAVDILENFFKFDMAVLATERSIYERPFRLIAGLFDHSDIIGQILSHLMLDFMWFTYDTFRKLDWQSLIWSDSTLARDLQWTDSSATIGQLVNKPTLSDDTLPPTMFRLVNDYVIAKEYAKASSNFHIQDNPVHSDLLDSDHSKPTDPPAHHPDSSSDKRSRPVICDEFMRTAHLFFSNIDSSFLWTFIEDQFGLYFAQFGPPTVSSHATFERQWPNQRTPIQLELDQWCHVMHFLITQLPLDTYPNVNGLHLPKLMCYLISKLIDMLERTDDGRAINVQSYLVPILGVLDVLIDRVKQYAVTLFDQILFPSNRKSTASTDDEIPLDQKCLDQLTLIASAIGQFRQLVGTFCTHVIKFSDNKLNHLLEKISRKQPNALFDLYAQNKLNADWDPIDSDWLNLFAHLCRLVIELSNVSLPCFASNEFVHALGDRHHQVDLFCGDMQISQESEKQQVAFISPKYQFATLGRFILPHWFLCLLYAAAEVNNFDFKSIAMYTLLELFYASISVHGWNSELPSVTKKEPLPSSIQTNRGMRLAFPVLSGRLMTYLCRETDLFTLLSISLWTYLSPNTSTYHEDVTNLLISLHQLNPPIVGTLSCNNNTTNSQRDSFQPSRLQIHSHVETFILSQMCSANSTVQLDAFGRFVNLWHLMRSFVNLPADEHRLSANDDESKTSTNQPLHKVKNKATAWRRMFLRSNRLCGAVTNRSTDELEWDRSAQCTIPFYHCTLLLLDNLDFENPWGPTGSVGCLSNLADFIGPNSPLTTLSKEADAKSMYDVQTHAKFALCEMSKLWIEKAMRMKQIDRVLAPILAALMHPSTARLSLKAFVLNQLKVNTELDDKVTTARDPMQQNSIHCSKSVDSFSVEPRLGENGSQLDSVVVSRAAFDCDIFDSSSKQLSESQRKVIKDSELHTLLPMNEHLLIYLQSYDANQVIYGFSRLRSILSISPQLFVQSLLNHPLGLDTTSSSSSSSSSTSSSTAHKHPVAHIFGPTLFGLDMYDLLVRHRRSLVGLNFYQNATGAELRDAYKSYANMLELIVDLCLQFMCTFVPTTNYRLTRHEFSREDVEANQFVQSMAAQVLELILKQLVIMHEQSIICINNVKNTVDSVSKSQLTNPSKRNARDIQLQFGLQMNHELVFNSTKRKQIEQTINRTSILPIVIHCLGSAILLAHWPKVTLNENDLQQNQLTEYLNQIKSLPTCFQLLLSNQFIAHLPSHFPLSYTQTLLKLLQTVLKLKPWYDHADRLSTPTANVIRLHQQYPTCIIWPAYDSQSTLNLDIVQSSLTIWSKALHRLANPIVKRLNLVRSSCLSIHYDSFGHMSSTSLASSTISSAIGPSNQAAMFGEIMCLSLAIHPQVDDDGGSSRSIRTQFDMHRLWFEFILESLAYWGWFGPVLVRNLLKQLCTNLDAISHFVLATVDPIYKQEVASSSISTLSFDFTNLPSDYVLSYIGLFQSILHAFLLNGNLRGSVMGLSRHSKSSTATTTATTLSSSSSSSSYPLSSPLRRRLSKDNDTYPNFWVGLSAQLVSLVDIVEVLNHHDVAMTDGASNSANQAVNVTCAALTNSHILTSVLVNDGLGSSAVDIEGVSLGTDVGSLSEPAIILNSGLGDETSENRDNNNNNNNSQNLSATFVNRTKNIQDESALSVSDILHPYVQIQTELFRLLPSVLETLALFWNVFNQSPIDGLNNSLQFQSNYCGQLVDQHRHVPRLLPSFSMEHVSELTCAGSMYHVCLAIRHLLKPIANYLPDLFLITSALSWPSTLLDLETGGLKQDYQSTGSMRMLNPQRIHQRQVHRWGSLLGSGESFTLPLHPKQANLLHLLSGFNQDSTLNFGPMISANKVVNHLRDTIKRPMSNVFLSTSSLLSSSLTTNTYSAPTNLSAIGELSSSTEVTRPKNVSVPSRFGTNSNTNALCLQTNLLHLFYAWITQCPQFVSADLLLNLIRDMATMPVLNNIQSSVNSPVSLCPASVFVVLKLCNVYLEMDLSTDDKREQKELQEVVHKILETMVSIAASALHQPSWFRRTLQIRQPETDAINTHLPDAVSTSTMNIDSISKHQYGDMNKSNSVLSINVMDVDADQSKSDSVSMSSSFVEPKQSFFKNPVVLDELNRIRTRSDVILQSIELLSEHMANFLDVIYRSDEKDRIPTFLSTVLANIFPYLRVRILSNSDHFTVASKLVSSICSYQYTRRAWRRDVLDLFFEPAFFQMTALALQNWNGIVDNLMTQDKSTLKEVLARLVFTQSGGLNLFANKDIENESRAAVLKKISYIVYVSESDQYAKSVPDLLERLTECLRLSATIIPVIHAQVFLFARVLISRLSAVHLISLWPLVIPELYLTFKSLLETIQENVSMLKTKKCVKLNKTLFSTGHLNLYLGACKFLATCLLCPDSRLPQFSFYQWVFVSELKMFGCKNFKNDLENNSHRFDYQKNAFVPLLTNLLDKFEELILADNLLSNSNEFAQTHVTWSKGCLNLLAMDKIVHIMDLYPFIKILNTDVLSNVAPSCITNPSINNDLLLDLSLEAALTQQFVEPIPQSTTPTR